MSEEITREVFDHLVDLAALELDDAESEYLRGQLNQQLNAIRQLAAVPLDELASSAPHGVNYTGEISQPPREDEPLKDKRVADILEQVPETAEGWIVVPEIPSQAVD